MHGFFRGGVLALLMMVAASAFSADEPAGTLKGVAAYVERLALPPDAVLVAELQDISRAGAPAKVLGRARLDPAGQQPFRFEIRYDETSIRPGGRYGVRARITHRGQVLFTTDPIQPVLDGRHASLTLRLVPTAEARRREAAGAPRTAP